MLKKPQPVSHFQNLWQEKPSLTQTCRWKHWNEKNANCTVIQAYLKKLHVVFKFPIHILPSQVPKAPSTHTQQNLATGTTISC